MKKRNAFTLIELLAVIVILAIIALITTTIITKVVENSRKNAAKNSALNYLDAVEKYIMYHDVDDTKYPYDLKDNTYNITENSTMEVPPLNDFIKVNGSKPTSGTITIDDKGKITNAEMVILNYNITCTSLTSCSVEGKDTDPTPVLTIGNVTSDNTSITIPYTVEIEKGNTTVECIYGTDTKYGQTGVINEENNTCTLSNLTVGTTYYFKLTPKSDKNKRGKSITSSKATASYIPATEFKVGDYVYMVPSYDGEYTPTTDSSSPYYTGTNTPGSITPSELRRWIIIKNDDTGIEMISESISSTTITFYNTTGYENYVGVLNEIAKQYENDKFTDGSRHMGYYSQKLTCGSYSDSDCRDGNLHFPDTGYDTGTGLVEHEGSNEGRVYNAIAIARGTTINPLKAYKVNSLTYEPSNESDRYYISSRFVYDGGSYAFRCIGENGNVSYMGIFRTWDVFHSQKLSVRPILSLKPNVVADPSGDGSSEHPWVLVEQS